MWDAIREVVAPIGINFAFERMTRGPASLDGHLLVRFAGREVPGSESALIEHISSSFFEQAKVIDDPFLIAAGELAGNPAERAAAFLASDEDIEPLFKETKGWRARGVTSMPSYFVSGQRLLIQQASIEIFEGLLRQ